MTLLEQEVEMAAQQAKYKLIRSWFLFHCWWKLASDRSRPNPRYFITASKNKATKDCPQETCPSPPADDSAQKHTYYSAQKRTLSKKHSHPPCNVIAGWANQQWFAARRPDASSPYSRAPRSRNSPLQSAIQRWLRFDPVWPLTSTVRFLSATVLFVYSWRCCLRIIQDINDRKKWLVQTYAQARNQFGTPGEVKSSLRGSQIF